LARPALGERQELTSPIGREVPMGLGAEASNTPESDGIFRVGRREVCKSNTLRNWLQKAQYRSLLRTVTQLDADGDFAVSLPLAGANMQAG
jgi:hypothetical protein